MACDAWDRYHEAREILARDGIVVGGRQAALRPHPAIAIERDNRVIFARLISQLALDGEPSEIDPNLRAARRSTRPHPMVKRSSRIPRINAEISEEAAQAFKKALEIRDHREAQLANGDHCQGAGSCSSCDEYERLVALVDTALNIQPQELSPIDVFDAPAPPMWKDRQKEDWDRARAQHVALAKAAGIAPRQKGLLTDGCRAQANIRWIERYGKYPDGLFVGKPFRLHEFQRDIIRGIYGDPAYWRAVDAALRKKGLAA